MAALDDLGALPPRESPTVAWAIAGSLLLHGLLLAWLPPLAPAFGAAPRALPVMLQVRLLADAPAPSAAREPVAAAKAPAPSRAAVPRIPPAPLDPRAATIPSAVAPPASAPASASGAAPLPAPVSFPGAPAATQDVTVAEPVVTPPDLRAAYLANPRPPYPLAARRLGLEGRVLLRAQILENGRCGRIMVSQSSGHALLDDAALQAVRGWRFVPATRAGEAVAAWVEIPISFRLDGRES